ncbi:MAG: M48 family metallopeptidase [bacterium]
MYGNNQGNRSNNGWAIRIGIAVILAGFAFFKYLGSSQVNPVTGQKQHVALSQSQEIALGVQSAPVMVREHGGEVTSGSDADLVHRVGQAIVDRTEAGKSHYQFQFHLLSDDQTVNAFALPGGQVFITEALLKKLQTEGQLAGVLGHEIGHVVARHGAQQLAKQELTQGLANSATVASNGYGGDLARQVGTLVNLKYGRGDELEADNYGVRYCAKAGYDPRAMLGVMKILASLSANGRTPEMLSTHPNPSNRAEKIEEALKEEFPGGVPSGLKP